MLSNGRRKGRIKLDVFGLWEKKSRLLKGKIRAKNVNGMDKLPKNE